MKHKPSRRFLESLDNYFLTQEVDDPTMNGMLLNLILINKEDLFGDVNDGHSFGCSDHETIEITRGKEKAGQ